MSDYKSKFCYTGLPGNKNLQYTATCHYYLLYYILIAAFRILILYLPKCCFSWDTLLIFKVSFKNGSNSNFQLTFPEEVLPVLKGNL